MSAGTEPATTSPKLGVVVPTYDEAERLPALLGRLLDSSLPDDDRADDVVVADGGSRDATVRIAERSGVRVIEATRGRGSQLAAGASALSNDVLLFLHADCRPAPGALAELRHAFRDPELVASAMSQRIEAPGLFYRLVEKASDARSRRGMVFGDCGLAVRRGAYERVGGFRPLSVMEDVDISRRLRRDGPVRLVPGARLVVSPRRWRTEGALRCTLRNWMLRLMFAVGVPAERLAGLYPAQRRPGT